MNTIALWYIISVSFHRQVDYSPPMPDAATCEFVLKSLKESAHSNIDAKCFQVKTVVTK